MKNKFTHFLAILILAISNLLHAGDIDETSEIASKLNALQGTSNSGREYLFSIPPVYDAQAGGLDNFIRVFVISPVVTNVKVGIGGSYKTFTSQGNGLTVVDIPTNAAMAFTYNPSANQPAAKIYKDKSIHVLAEEPVIVYCMVRYKNTTDGFLPIPNSAMGRDYAIASMPQWGGTSGNKFTPFVNISASFDKTRITFTMGGGSVPSYTEVEGGVMLATGQSKSYTLNKGETLIFCASSKDSKGNIINGTGQDLAGSRVTANKPIAVVTGHACANVPINNNTCDYIAEMESPTNTWGKNVIVPVIPNRKKAGIIRIFGKENDTEVYRNGSIFDTIPAIIGAENVSFTSQRLWDTNSTPRPAVLTSNKPFNAVFFNTGQSEDNIPSDPFSMNLIPIEQYQNDIQFCTPNAAGGDPFNLNWLNIVIEADENGFIPNDFEFGTFTSDWQWQKVIVMPGFVYSNVPSFRMDNNPSNPLVKYLIKNIALPYSGVFRLQCKSKKFTSYSYGYGTNESYGYPTGAALKDLTNTQDTYKPIPTYTMECDGERGLVIRYGKVLDPIFAGEQSSQSKLSDIYMKRNESYNYDFKVLSQIEPGLTDMTSWSLTKINPMQDSKAVLVFKDVAGNDTTIIIEDIATNIGISKDENFGNFKMNEPSVSRTFTITNNSRKTILLNKLKLRKGNEGFKIEPFNWQLPQPMQIGESRNIKITFFPDSNLPKGKTLFIDSLGVGDTCVFMDLVEVRASLGSPLIQADDWNFGSIDILNATPIVKNIRLSNPSQEADLRITGASALTEPSFNAVFNFPTIKKLADITPSNPIILKTNSYFDFTVYFKPNRVGLIRDSIVFTSDAAAIDNITYLNGIGIDSISSDVGEEFINKIDISTKSNSIYISNANQELLSYRLSDLQGKLISTGIINSTNEITLKEQSAQALIIEIINKESKVLMRKKLILER